MISLKLSAILLFYLFSHVNINETVIIRTHVPKMELNHVYKENSGISLDQLILWEYDRSLPNSEYDKVIMWLKLDIREKLTEEEIRVKQNELNNQWYKKHKRLDTAPEYVPAIRLDAKLPYYDSVIGKYKIFVNISNRLYIITSDEYYETHTQYDKEIENQDLFPVHTRRAIPEYRSVYQTEGHIEFIP